jgi:hypothetical protein
VNCIVTSAVQRGFATTSVAPKKPAVSEEQAPVTQDTGASSSTNATNHHGATTTPVSTEASQPEKEDWEDEKAVEQAALQSLVDKLHEKGEKEVSRILKVRIHGQTARASLLIAYRPLNSINALRYRFQNWISIEQYEIVSWS